MFFTLITLLFSAIGLDPYCFGRDLHPFGVCFHHLIIYMPSSHQAIVHDLFILLAVNLLIILVITLFLQAQFLNSINALCLELQMCCNMFIYLLSSPCILFSYPLTLFCDTKVHPLTIERVNLLSSLEIMVKHVPF